MGICIDNILNPKKSIDEIKNKLFSIYTNDYGSESSSIINNRWNNTIFMTDVLPFELKKFIDKYKEDIHNPLLIVKANIEYLDFIRIQKEVDKKIAEEFSDYVRERFQIYTKDKIRKFWKFDSDDIEAYIDYGWDIVNPVISKKKQLLDERKTVLISDTLWGKRMQKKYRELSKEQLIDILLQDTYPALTCVVQNNNNEFKTVCQIPLIRYIDLPSLDRVVFHEFRHVVETEGNRSGLSMFPKAKYDILNEIRTEKNALDDEKKIDVIFSRLSDLPQSPYELLVPYLDDMGDFTNFLNKIAFSGKLDENNDILFALNSHLSSMKNSVKTKINKLKK